MKQTDESGVTIAIPNQQNQIVLYRVPRYSFSGVFQDCLTGMPVQGQLSQDESWKTELWEVVSIRSE